MPEMIGENEAKKLLQSFLGPLQTPAVWIDVPDGHRDGGIPGPSRATCLDPCPAAENSSCLVCCPLQVDEALGGAWIELRDVDAVNPQLRGDLDDSVPMRILRGSADHANRPRQGSVSRCAPGRWGVLERTMGRASWYSR